VLVERIESFVRDASSADFDALAREAFAFQFERLEAYRALCERRGVAPGDVESWERVPTIPTLAFKGLELATDPPRETFRSSGTTSERRSVHLHPYPDLYRATLDASFPRAALPAGAAAGDRVPMLSLVPSRRQIPDSSLGFMVDHVIARWGDDTSLCAIGKRGVDARQLRAWLAARQRAGRPALVLTTALALLEALDALDRLGVRFRLPPGSLVFETGGYKGKRREVSAQELAGRLEATLGVSRDAVVREYGMTELTSQLYTRLGVAPDAPRHDAPQREARSGEPDALFFAPHWVRVRVLDPATLEPLPDGETGMVAIFDLANVGSALHLLTEDLGCLDRGGLRLGGRAAGAELRGCSLTVEELAAGSLCLADDGSASG
jgi:hypothetical protein